MAQPYEVRVVNAPPSPLRDVYHLFLRASWPVALGVITAAYAALNAVFALGFLATGGIANARPGSFVDAFDFSVQTMGTIGYGAMAPVSRAANVLVDLESLVSLTATALATGLLFSKFSRPTVRVAFSRRAVISPVDGVPTLMVRIGNERGNRIMDTELRMILTRTEITREGSLFYRMLDLKLVRDRAPALTRSFLVMHRIEPGSPLYGATPASLRAEEAELNVAVAGTDDVSLLPVYAGATWMDADLAWGARHADVLSERPDGTMVLDVSKFHDIEPTEPTPAFPYPRGAG